MNTQDRYKHLLERSGFYHIKCLINDRIYAGKTIRKMRLRRSEHATRLTRGTHDNIDLQEDFDKYGMDYFEFIPMMTIMTGHRKHSAGSERNRSLFYRQSLRRQL